MLLSNVTIIVIVIVIVIAVKMVPVNFLPANTVTSVILDDNNKQVSQCFGKYQASI